MLSSNSNTGMSSCLHTGLDHADWSTNYSTRVATDTGPKSCLANADFAFFIMNPTLDFCYVVYA